MFEKYKNKATCDLCGRVFIETKKRYYCSHCKKYYHVCFECKDDVIIKCARCGIPLIKKTEPKKTLYVNY